MKQAFVLLLGSALIGSVALAQTSTTRSQSSRTINSNQQGAKREIVIEEKTDGKTEKMVVVIDGDKVTINGKPASEYKGNKNIMIDDEIIINGNEVIVLGGKGPKGAKGPKEYREIEMIPYASGSTAKPRGFLGVVSEKGSKGARITEVVDGTAADKAGLKVGDEITAINGKAVNGEDGLMEVIRQYKPEEQVDVTYLRDGKEKKVKATLGKSSSGAAWSPAEWSWNGEVFEGRTIPGVRMPGMQNEFFAFNYGRPKYGMGVEDYADGDGVLVNSVDSGTNAAKAGLLKDDIITAVNNNPVKNLDELRNQLALEEDQKKSSIELKVLRAGRPETVTLRVPKRIKSADL